VVTSAAPEDRGFFEHDSSGAAGFFCRAVAFAIAIFFWASGVSCASGLRETADASILRPWPGPGQPVFTLKDVDGSTQSLSGYRGQPVLVHFFATWCEPCRPEMQALERLAQRTDAKALRIISISVNEPVSRVRRFFQKMPVSFSILLDDGREIAKAWNVDILPTSYLLDADLAPRLYVEREVEWDRIDIIHILNALTARHGRLNADWRQISATTQ
jgi:peroxiredoxin